MGSAATIRTFWALEPSEAARRIAADRIRELREALGDALRWVREESLHVTLRFLGETESARVPELVREVEAATRGIAPFALKLGALHPFPTPRRPRVLALALEPEAPLVALAAAVERGARAAGFEPETRRFRPHLTLGRVRPGRRVSSGEISEAVTASVTGSDEAWEVMESVLMRSDLSSDRPHYTPLARVPLGSPGGPLHP